MESEVFWRDGKLTHSCRSRAGDSKPGFTTSATTTTSDSSPSTGPGEQERKSSRRMQSLRRTCSQSLTSPRSRKPRPTCQTPFDEASIPFDWKNILEEATDPITMRTVAGSAKETEATASQWEGCREGMLAKDGDGKKETWSTTTECQ